MFARVVVALAISVVGPGVVAAIVSAVLPTGWIVTDPVVELPEEIDRLPAQLKPVPARRMLPPAVLIPELTTILPPVLFRVMLPEPLLAMAELVFTVMVLAAFKVRLVLADQLMGAATVIVPVPAPLEPLFVVVTMMLLVARAFCSVVVFTVAVAAPEFGVKVLEVLV